MSKTPNPADPRADAAGPRPAAELLEESPLRARATIRTIAVTLAYEGYTLAILTVAAPWISQSFNLDQSGIARLYAWISINALGGLLLARMADRVGRRRIILVSLGGTPLFALGAALSHTQFWFVVFEILVYACIAATIAVSMVIVAEELPIAGRAKGQSYAGLGLSVGGGFCIFLMPFLQRAGFSWRWLLFLSAAGIVLLPLMARKMKESRRWTRAAGAGRTVRQRFHSVFDAPYRRRSVPVLLCALFGMIPTIAVNSWTYFHAVSVVGLSASKTSALLIVAGGVGLAGFPLGAWASERFGRVRTAVWMWLASAAGALAFYWGPPAHFAWPAIWLGVSYGWFIMSADLGTVAINSAVTELFPTSLRSTIIGWVALVSAISAVAAQGTIAVLAGPLGGLSTVVGYLALLEIPSAIIFGAFVDETRGLSLEAASGEETWQEFEPPS